MLQNPDEELSLVYFQKAVRDVPTPFLVLGVRFVTIVAAQSLQFGMAVNHYIFAARRCFSSDSSVSKNIVVLSFRSLQLSRKIKSSRFFHAQIELLKINLSHRIYHSNLSN